MSMEGRVFRYCLWM